MPLDPRWAIDAIWIVFAVVWAVTALHVSPAARRQSRLSRLQYTLFLLVCAVLLFRRILAIGPLAWRFLPDTLSVAWTGVALVAVGAAIAIVARFFLGRNWSGTVTVKKGHELIRGGPYAVVRHPIYSGILLGLLGTAIDIGEVRGLIAVAFAALGLRLKSLTEEQFMEQEFGSEYREYKQRVKALIPLVW